MKTHTIGFNRLPLFGDESGEVLVEKSKEVHVHPYEEMTDKERFHELLEQHYGVVGDDYLSSTFKKLNEKILARLKGFDEQHSACVYYCDYTDIHKLRTYTLTPRPWGERCGNLTVVRCTNEESDHYDHVFSRSHKVCSKVSLIPPGIEIPQ